jgi:Nucleotidyl transferase AbiEii toxin, Type IV TA system
VDYKAFLQQSIENRRGAFGAAAADLGTSPRNVEKDFWICVVLESVFLDSTRQWPRMAFRGGTSLSKAFNATKRFSEDIDIAVDRADLRMDATLARLEQLTPSALSKRLDAFNTRGATFVRDQVAPHIERKMKDLFPSRLRERPSVRVQQADRLTLEIEYRSVLSAEQNQYIRPIVRLEFSVRSALDPRTDKSITPYVAKVIPDASMTIKNIPTLAARRTFWDKILIAHELKDKHSKGLRLALHDERVSRHYYDLLMLIRGRVGVANKAQLKLARECQRYSTLFYPDEEVDITDALPGTLDIVPDDAMARALADDYRSMGVMIFDEPPSFAEISAELREFENKVNTLARSITKSTGNRTTPRSVIKAARATA